jgi:hypothetical protein
VTYAYEQDEGNATAAGNTPLAAAAPGVPRNVRPRHIVLEWTNAGTAGQGTGITRRRIVVGAIADFNAFTEGDTLSLPEYQATAGVGQTTPNVMRDFVIIYKRHEVKSKTPRLTDTNMDQG